MPANTICNPSVIYIERREAKVLRIDLPSFKFIKVMMRHPAVKKERILTEFGYLTNEIY